MIIRVYSALGALKDTSAGAIPAPADAHYVTTQAEGGLSNEFSLGGLTTGLVKISVSAGVATPSTAVDTVDYTSPAFVPYKPPVVAVAVANVNIASPGATLDGVTLASGDRILLTAQSTAAQKGLWVWNGASSALTRPTDYAAASTTLAFFGVTALVKKGDAKGGSVWTITSTGTLTIDTTAVTWTQLRPSIQITDGSATTQEAQDLDFGDVPKLIVPGSTAVTTVILDNAPRNPGGRATLSSSLAIPTTDLTGSVIYYLPFGSNVVDVYDNILYHATTQKVIPDGGLSYDIVGSGLTKNRMYDLFFAGNAVLDTAVWNAPSRDTHISSISNASPRVVSDATAQPVAGQIIVISGNGVSSNNDVWRVGTVTAGVSFTLLNKDGTNSSAPGSVGNNGTWEVVDDTTVTRATALTLYQGREVRTSDKALYIATFKTNPTTLDITDSVLKRQLVNRYNLAERELRAIDTTDSWNYNSSTYRAARNDFANRVEFIANQINTLVKVTVLSQMYGTSTAGNVGIGLDSTSTNTAQLLSGFNMPNITTSANLYIPVHATYDGQPAVGYHFLQWVERAITGTPSFKGDDGGNMQAGIRAHIMG